MHHQIIMQTCYVSFKFLLFPDEDAQVGSMLDSTYYSFLCSMLREWRFEFNLVPSMQSRMACS